MPNLTPKLSLKQPLGNETVSRESYNENLRLIDQNAAAQVQVDEPFYLKSATYNETFHRLELTLGPGRAAFLNNMVSMSVDSVFIVDTPLPNTSYYLFIHSDGSFSYQLNGNESSGGVLIWKVTTGEDVRAITKEDMRGRLCGAAARIVQDNLITHVGAGGKEHALATPLNNGFMSAADKAFLDVIDPLGVPKPYFLAVLPPKHLWCDGKTIGDSFSGATARASEDVRALFEALWNSINNSELPIYKADGTLGERGITALKDFNDHKRLSLPDMRGRVPLGKDNMGGTPANRVMAQSTDILGGNGGEENHLLTINEMPVHTHGSPTTNGLAGPYEVPSTGGGYDYGSQSAPTMPVGGGN